MIPDPQNPFEQLQNDVAQKLMDTPPFNSIKFPDGSTFKVLTEDEGDIQFDFDAMISVLGLSLIVHSPTGKIAQPDIPGPLISEVAFDVWVSEAPTFNRSEHGTQVRLSKAMTIVIGTIHGFEPATLNPDPLSSHNPIYAVGFDKHRERVYNGAEDRTGFLIISRIVHFICPQIAAEITSP